MTAQTYPKIAAFLREELRLKTFPLAITFLKRTDAFPEKTRRPSKTLGKRITICQAVTMARLYGWTVGLTREDLICVPAMIAFGFSDAPEPSETLSGLFCKIAFAPDQETARREVDTMTRLENGEYPAVLLAPLAKRLFEPDTVVVYANPAQVMRMVQALVYADGKRIPGNFGGKVECTEYLLAPFKTGRPRIAMPGMGDRIFSMTQDDEMVLSLPGSLLAALGKGLERAGREIAARYPVPFYQNFQPEFPDPYRELADELDLF